MLEKYLLPDEFENEKVSVQCDERTSLGIGGLSL